MHSDPHIRQVLEELDWMKRVARSETRDLHAADDALQDAFVRVLRVRPRATGGPELRSWLRRVVRSVARQGLRSEARRGWREFLATSSPESPSPADDVAERASDAERVQRALARVREPYGSAVRLRYLEGLSAVDTAVRLRISPEAVRQRTSRGLRLLRAELERPDRPQSMRNRLAGLLLLVRRRPRSARIAWALSLAACLATVVSWLGLGGATLGAERNGTAAAAVASCSSEGEVALVAASPSASARTPWPEPPRPGSRPQESSPELTLPTIALELQPGDWFGKTPTRLGDLDGDGNPEIAVGAPAGGAMSAGEGAVWIVTVDDEDRVFARSRIVRPAGLGPKPLQDGRELFGYALTSLGDLDGDGGPELAVGAPWFDSRAGITSDGAVWVLFLDRSGRLEHARELSAGTEACLAGILEGDGFGAQTAALGDVDGDGIGDLAVGAHGSDDGGEGRGAVWILFLRADASVRAAREISATEGGFAGLLKDGGHLGHGLGALGDLDGDGVSELAVAAPLAPAERPDPGDLWILFLRRDGSVRWEQRIAPDELSTGPLVTAKFGGRIEALGDLNGDGRIEVAIGACGDSRIFTLARDGSVAAISTEAIYNGALLLGATPDGEVRYLYTNCKADEERGWLRFHRIALELRPEYPLY